MHPSSRFVTLAVALAAFLAPCVARGSALDEIQSTTAAEAPSTAGFRRSLEAGLNLYGFDYAESLAPPHRSAEKGFLPGLQARFDVKNPTDRWYVAAIMDANFVSTNYSGTLQSSNPSLNGQPIAYSHAATMFQLEGVAGVRFLTLTALRFDTYLGLGYRIWSRGRPSDGAGSYKEDYQWMYVPLGVRVAYDFSEAIEATLDLSLRFPFFGRIKFFFSGASPTYSDTDALLGGNIVGVRAQVPVRLKRLFGRDFGLVLTPWFEFSAIGAGPPAPLFVNGVLSGTASEPSSRTYQYGLVAAVEISL